MDRREFAALAALGLAGAASAQDETPKPTLADATFDAILARAGAHLDEADRKALRGRLRNTEVGRLARDLKLDWRDEPAFVYPPAPEE